MSTSPGKYDLIRRIHQCQLTSSVELGTLQQLALSAIVSNFEIYKKEWILSMPCISKDLRQEICKRIMYKGMLDNDLFSLCVDVNRRVWDLRSIRTNFTDSSCDILARVNSLEILRLSHPSSSSIAMGAMIKNFAHLRLLEIIYTKNLDDSVIQIVAKSCPLLEVLNVKATSVTDESMKALHDNELKLLELDISYTSISHVGIEYLKSGPIQESLKLLRFKNCQLLGSAKLVCDIILSFPNLKDYSFDFNREGEGEAEIGWALNHLPGPAPGQNVFFNIPL